MMSSGRTSYNGDECQMQPKPLVAAKLNDDEFSLLKETYKDLQADDLLLMEEPENVVYIRDQHAIQDPITGRITFYISKKTYSYVEVLDDVTTKSFGSIKKCFSHNFAGNTTDFVVLNVYSCSHQDLDTNFWWVFSDTATHLKVLPVKFLSTPLVIACLKEDLEEHERTWFLNA